MRTDMSKVLTERPRRGHRLPSSKTASRVRRYDPEEEYDDLPTRVSGSRNKHICAEQVKYFSDLLGPLRRFLRKNVGRPWDKVYSEMKACLDERKVTGLHVFQHVDREVATHPHIGDDGGLYQKAYGGRLLPVYGLYVDPRTGLLCWSDKKPWWGERRKSPADGSDKAYVRLSENTGYVKMNGIWYFIEFRKYERAVDGQWSQQTAPRSIPEISDTPLQILRKKQLSQKELKTANLRNDPPSAANDRKS